MVINNQQYELLSLDNASKFFCNSGLQIGLKTSKCTEFFLIFTWKDRFISHSSLRCKCYWTMAMILQLGHNLWVFTLVAHSNLYSITMKLQLHKASLIVKLLPSKLLIHPSLVLFLVVLKSQDKTPITPSLHQSHYICPTTCAYGKHHNQSIKPAKHFLWRQSKYHDRLLLTNNHSNGMHLLLMFICALLCWQVYFVNAPLPCLSLLAIQ